VPLFQAESADTPGEGIEGSLGAMGPDGLHWGTYLHDLFHNDDLREAWMAWLWVRKGCEPPGSGPHATKARASAVVAIAAGVRPHLNLEFIYGVLGLPGPRGSER
jgi:adenosylcobyric acid synthase